MSKNDDAKDKDVHPPMGTEDHPPREYVWRPKPINVWLSMNPSNNLQLHVLEEMRKRLEAHGCIFVPVPVEETELGSVAHLAIGFGESLREELDPTAIYGRLPKPRGTVLVITTIANMPETELFSLARGQLLKKAGQTGMIVEGDLSGTTVGKALWASMAGNHCLIEDEEKGLLDNLALRVLAHAGAEKVNTHEGDDETWVTWEEWSALPLHSDIAQAARALGKAGIVEDEVSLDQYGSHEQAHKILRFLQRTTLGEGMRSQLDPESRVMGVTTSGGGKATVSADPLDGHVVPVCQLTWEGYVRAIPRDCPVAFIAPSVETHENGMVYLAGALVNAGVVNGFDSFIRFLRDHFSKNDKIDIIPRGMQPKVLSVEHFHLQPKKGSIEDPARVEVVYPDEECFPEIDFPCGMREAELLLLSALFRARALREPGPLDKVVVAVLPGHGSVAVYGEPRQELTDILVNGMEMEEVVRI